MFNLDIKSLIVILCISAIFVFIFLFYRTRKEKQIYIESNKKTIQEIQQIKSINNHLNEKNLDILSENKKLKLQYELSIEKIAEELNIKSKQLDNLLTKTNYLLQLYPVLELYFSEEYNNTTFFPSDLLDDFSDKSISFYNILKEYDKNKHNYHFQTYYREYLLKEKFKLLKEIEYNSVSHKKIIPYMAQIYADIETTGIERLAESLDWGKSQERAHKVKSIREIRKDAQAIVEKNIEAKYQLAYLLNLFPTLEDVIECEFKQLPPIDIDAISDYDKSRDFLSKEEYENLTQQERNQLALDRYINSHNKTKWQIGRDYELYVGYMYSKKGYSVDYFGSYMGLEDLGRDLICKKDNQTLIIQCKYWSHSKQIHEKHITQLYGTLISYCIENKSNPQNTRALLITNTRCSQMAKQMAEYLNITIAEDVNLKEYPRIKCNIGHDEHGNIQKIYHLPFDQQYDSTKITEKGEFFAFTVKEAEEAGFRRAHKWLTR